MLFNLSHFPGVAERVGRSTIIDVRAGEASVLGITGEISRSGLGIVLLFFSFGLTQCCLILKKFFAKKQPILHSTEYLNKIFKETPFIAYRRSPNLRDLLVWAKLNNNNTMLKPTSGTFRCNSKHGCLTCPYIDNGRTTYTFSNTGEMR